MNCHYCGAQCGEYEKEHEASCLFNPSVVERLRLALESRHFPGKIVGAQESERPLKTAGLPKRTLLMRTFRTWGRLAEHLGLSLKEGGKTQQMEDSVLSALEAIRWMADNWYEGRCGPCRIDYTEYRARHAPEAATADSLNNYYSGWQDVLDSLGLTMASDDYYKVMRSWRDDFGKGRATLEDRPNWDDFEGGYYPYYWERPDLEGTKVVIREVKTREAADMAYVRGGRLRYP